jgi:hypothetical protein
MADANDTPPPAEKKEEVVLGEDGQVWAHYHVSTALGRSARSAALCMPDARGEMRA